MLLPQTGEMPQPSTVDIELPSDLIDYLRRTGRIEKNETPVIQVLAGGVSNRTVLVLRENGDAWVLKQALAKLRVAVDWFSSPQRIWREALGTEWLPVLTGPGIIPALIFVDPADYILAMQAVPEPHANWKTLLLKGQIHADHIWQFGQILGNIHRQSYEQRDHFAAIFEDRGFFESLRIEPYYRYTAQQVPAAAPLIEPLIAETRQTRLTAVHGDYSPKNILIYQDHLILLDHEVIHFGDPAFDIGFSLTHFLSKANHLPAHRVAFRDAAHHYWQAYQQALDGAEWANAEFEHRAIRHTLACLLARVAGRSPLEYLTAEEKAHQQTVVLSLMTDPPDRMPDLIDQFVVSLQK